MAQMDLTSCRNTLSQMEPQMSMALPDHITPQKISRVIMTEITKNPKILKCTRESILTSAMEACQLGLVPNSVQGLAYMIPYGNRCQLITGYKGLIQLALQSGRLASIWGRVVREGDQFEYEEGTNPYIKHKPSTSSKLGEKTGGVVGAYAVAKMKGGEDTQFEYLTLLDIERVKARSSSGNRGPWVDDYEQMAKKTAVRQLLKWLPLESERVELAAQLKEGRGGGFSYNAEFDKEGLPVGGDFLYSIEDDDTSSKTNETFS